MDERKIQKSFIDQIKGKKKVQKKSIGVYKYLVHHSFFEVLTNAYPHFYKIIQDKKLSKEFDKSIYKFMQTNAFTPYMWQMPNEYRKFIKKSNFFKNIKYANDLLHFEYSELFIFMQPKTKIKKHPFSLSKEYKLSKNIVLHKYYYDVVNKDFNEKQKIYIIGYFDFHRDEVVYRLLDRVLYLFLTSIDSSKNLKKNLRLFFRKHNIAYKEYAVQFEAVLEELFSKKVII
ncbi:MAG: hypothetical protein WBG69_11710 [Arcobacteraceae bacterium]